MLKVTYSIGCLFACLLFTPVAFAACTMDTPQVDMAECHYQQYSVWLSCEQNSTIMSWHTVDTDSGNEDTRSRNYKIDTDPNLVDCQQSSADTYGNGYHVGHLAAINHFDEDTDIALETNFMTNLLPQIGSFNSSGAWRQSEKLVECYRDEPLAPLEVYVGPLFGQDPSNDIFSISHDLPQTPDFYWKVVYSPSQDEYDAWLMPNHKDAKASKLPSYRRSLRSLITVLRNENEDYYTPVIEKFKSIRNQGATQIELKWKSVCNDRQS